MDTKIGCENVDLTHVAEDREVPVACHCEYGDEVNLLVL
jgi:hypothetical protein